MLIFLIRKVFRIRKIRREKYVLGFIYVITSVLKINVPCQRLWLIYVYGCKTGVKCRLLALYKCGEKLCFYVCFQ